MAFLPEDVRSQQRVLGVVLLLGAATLFVLHVLVPRREAAANLRQRIGELERRNHAARNEPRDPASTRSELTEAERLLGALRNMVPRDPEVTDIYGEVAARSEARGLELVSVEPGRPDGPDGACCRRVRWEMVVEGQYHDLGEFLTWIASLPRIVRPSVGSVGGLGRTAEGRFPVRADVALETLVLGAGGETSTADADRETSTVPMGDTLFVYDRARFAYPNGERRNPFRPPAESGGSGPRFVDLRLSGILYGGGAGSVAVLRDMGTGRLHRLREGGRIGSVRLVEVRPDAVLFVVPGPAGSRRELLRVDPGEGSGGSR